MEDFESSYENLSCEERLFPDYQGMMRIHFDFCFDFLHHNSE